MPEDLGFLYAGPPFFVCLMVFKGNLLIRKWVLEIIQVKSMFILCASNLVEHKF